MAGHFDQVRAEHLRSGRRPPRGQRSEAKAKTEGWTQDEGRKITSGAATLIGDETATEAGDATKEAERTSVEDAASADRMVE